MNSPMPKCKITVLKRTLNKDLIDKYIDDQLSDIKACDIFEDGQEIIVDPNTAGIPDEFKCQFAWCDIRKDIMTIAAGANVRGMKENGTIITGCSDWFRNVIFKVERMK